MDYFSKRFKTEMTALLKSQLKSVIGDETVATALANSLKNTGWQSWLGLGQALRVLPRTGGCGYG
jgi:hypothetical protein